MALSTNSTYFDDVLVADIPDEADGDGLLDDWENGYFGDLDANPRDISFNGVDTVYAAYIAGLDPTDPDARFELSGLQNILWWNDASDRMYTIYWTSNLINGFDGPLTNTTGGAFTDTVHGADGQGFYKIEVEVE